MNIIELLREDNESIVGPPLYGELKVNSNFGMRNGRMHWGVDLRANSGTEIIAPESGEITQTDIIPKCGGVMVIKHDNGAQSRFCHVKEFKISKGAKVKKGDVIGLTGGGKNDNGKGNSMGPHLHYELKMPNSGSLVNPMDYINKSYKTKYSEPKYSEPKRERTDERKVLSGMKKFYKKNTILRYDESKVNEFNQDIWDLQFALQFLGFYPDKIDGKFTPLTRRAIGKFQKSIGNKKTGNYKSNEIKDLFLKLKENSFITKGHTPKIGTNDLQTKLQKTEKEKKVTNVDSDTSDSEYIILKPKDFNGTDVHVFFGGYHTNPTYSKGGHDMKAMKFYEQFLEQYANNRIILITHHINTLDSVESFVEKKFPGKKVVSIAGFSQGGRETWRHADDSNLKLVGLIDPSTYDTGLTFGSNTYMVCNPNNWGGTSFTNACRKRLKWYCENKDKGSYSGHIECPKIAHTGLVTYFYNKFSSKI